MGLVTILRSGVTSSSSSHSLGVRGACPDFFLLSASCIVPPPSCVSRPVPPEGASGSILAMLFLYSLVCSTSLPTPPPL
eukprot:3780433-Pleurochrysis_carterae.AAC.2